MLHVLAAPKLPSIYDKAQIFFQFRYDLRQDQDTNVATYIVPDCTNTYLIVQIFYKLVQTHSNVEQKSSDYVAKYIDVISWYTRTHILTKTSALQLVAIHSN